MSVLDRIRALETEQEGCVLLGNWKCGGCPHALEWVILPESSVAQQTGKRLDIAEEIDRHVEVHAEANRSVPR